ncbi:hypothetical protein KP509_25G030800 [Ceratopteris richardii]|uniref:DUF4219 domain-containing protein n=1 Tax=Ceratopteris richardii TaxID=49495 RepID=A0A8T2RRN6_CERRI|nr:hypothetical protein KP509_25G030800 [Ceratopteris richardii]
MAPSLHNLHLEGVEKLNGNKYATWRVKMESLLFFQDCWDLISMDRPTRSEEELSKWDKKAMFAVHMIRLSVKDDILSHPLDVKTPKKAWETLRISMSPGAPRGKWH